MTVFLQSFGLKIPDFAVIMAYPVLRSVGNVYVTFSKCLFLTILDVHWSAICTRHSARAWSILSPCLGQK